jgi:hypothetical protein
MAKSNWAKWTVNVLDGFANRLASTHSPPFSSILEPTNAVNANHPKEWP